MQIHHEKLNLQNKAADINNSKISKNNPYYKLLSTEFKMAKYLNLKLPLTKLKIICQIRTVHKNTFVIHFRYIKYTIDTSELCTTCNLQKHENLYHFLKERQMYLPIRKAHLNKYKIDNLDIDNLYDLLIILPFQKQITCFLHHKYKNKKFLYKLVKNIK